MEPKMIGLEEKTMVGQSIRMTLAEDTTQELWKSFMPHRQSIPNRVDQSLYNLKVFDQGFDPKQFHPSTPFVKWAAVEVLPRTHNEDPGMETLVLKGGLYAVFLHRGPADRFNQTLQYIFEEWLPASAYELDDRAHFERFTIDYHPADPEAVEEVWIPVKAVHE